MRRRDFLKIGVLGATTYPRFRWTDIGRSHVLTLSFDDGFRKSFYRIAEIHEEYGLKACLNIIAGAHLPGVNVIDDWIPEELLGDFDDWNALKSRGHEIMPHTWAHLNLTEVSESKAKENITKCLDYFEEHLEGYESSNAVFNFAYNASTSDLEALALERTRAVRTGGWLVLGDAVANALPEPGQRVRIGCWGYGPDNGDAYVETEVNRFLEGPGGWLVLNLHGLDDEGWGPISAPYLDTLLKRLTRIDYLSVLPAGEVLEAVGG